MMREATHNVAVEVGVMVAGELRDDGVAELCGRRYPRQPNREATRYGPQACVVVLAGQKLPITKPRDRRTDGSGAVGLETHRLIQDPKAMPVAALARMIRAVSTRDYHTSSTRPGSDSDSRNRA